MTRRVFPSKWTPTESTSDSPSCMNNSSSSLSTNTHVQTWLAELYEQLVELLFILWARSVLDSPSWWITRRVPWRLSWTRRVRSCTRRVPWIPRTLCLVQNVGSLPGTPKTLPHSTGPYDPHWYGTKTLGLAESITSLTKNFDLWCTTLNQMIDPGP